MPLLTRLKRFLETKIVSYEALVGLALCAGIAFFFLLAAGVAWLATIVGFIQASLIFCGIFVFLALGFWLFGRAKSKEATQKLTGATEVVQTASEAVESLVSLPKKVSKTDTFLAAALIIVLLFAGSWGSRRTNMSDL